MKLLLTGLTIILCLCISGVSYGAGYSWTLPTTNADGTVLDDLAGTKLYCNGVEKADVPAPGNTYGTDIPCKALTARCYDTSGNISVDSNALKTIPPSSATGLKKK